MNIESYSNHDTAATRMAARNTKVVLERQAQRNCSRITLTKVMIAAVTLVLLMGLYVTAPQHNLQECSGQDVPAHCVD